MSSSVCPAAWDSEDIDHWKTVVIQPGEMPGPLLEESSFATLFPRYREKYLQQVWPHVSRSIKDLVSNTDDVIVFVNDVMGVSRVCRVDWTS